MRSSKQRSRSKSNRNRSVGNIVNRVFDSSGPEGKVRGTPQQIIEKYNQLARDAHLSNDRVAAENFQQHAEHYLRMLGEAQREMDSRREQHDRDRGDQPDRDRGDQPDRDRGEGQRGGYRDDQPVVESRRDRAPEFAQPMDSDQPDAFGLADADAEPEADSGLVETPETAPRKPRRQRRPKSERPEQPDTPEAAE